MLGYARPGENDTPYFVFFYDKIEGSVSLQPNTEIGICLCGDNHCHGYNSTRTNDHADPTPFSCATQRGPPFSLKAR